LFSLKMTPDEMRIESFEKSKRLAEEVAEECEKKADPDLNDKIMGQMGKVVADALSSLLSKKPFLSNSLAILSEELRGYLHKGEKSIFFKLVVAFSIMMDEWTGVVIGARESTKISAVIDNDVDGVESTVIDSAAPDIRSSIFSRLVSKRKLEDTVITSNNYRNELIDNFLQKSSIMYRPFVKRELRDTVITSNNYRNDQIEEVASKKRCFVRKTIWRRDCEDCSFSTLSESELAAHRTEQQCPRCKKMIIGCLMPAHCQNHI
ncbi:hypothetical protein PFISCL1PPCAC_24511, partial [Pristionchus fissidentatus]